MRGGGAVAAGGGFRLGAALGERGGFRLEALLFRGNLGEGRLRGGGAVAVGGGFCRGAALGERGSFRLEALLFRGNFREGRLRGGGAVAVGFRFRRGAALRERGSLRVEALLFRGNFGEGGFLVGGAALREGFVDCLDALFFGGEFDHRGLLGGDGGGFAGVHAAGDVALTLDLDVGEGELLLLGDAILCGLALGVGGLDDGLDVGGGAALGIGLLELRELALLLGGFAGGFGFGAGGGLGGGFLAVGGFLGGLGGFVVAALALMRVELAHGRVGGVGVRASAHERAGISADHRAALPRLVFHPAVGVDELAAPFRGGLDGRDDAVACLADLGRPDFEGAALLEVGERVGEAAEGVLDGAGKSLGEGADDVVPAGADGADEAVAGLLGLGHCALVALEGVLDLVPDLDGRRAGVLEVLEFGDDGGGEDAHVAQLHGGAGDRLAVADGGVEAADGMAHVLDRLADGGGGIADHLERLLVAEGAVGHHHQRAGRRGELVEVEGRGVAERLQIGHVGLGLVDVADEGFKLGGLRLEGKRGLHEGGELAPCALDEGDARLNVHQVAAKGEDGVLGLGESLREEMGADLDVYVFIRHGRGRLGARGTAAQRPSGRTPP